MIFPHQLRVSPRCPPVAERHCLLRVTSVRIISGGQLVAGSFSKQERPRTSQNDRGLTGLERVKDGRNVSCDPTGTHPTPPHIGRNLFVSKEVGRLIVEA